MSTAQDEMLEVPLRRRREGFQAIEPGTIDLRFLFAMTCTSSPDSWSTKCTLLLLSLGSWRGVDDSRNYTMV